jgi:phytol kinase
LNEWLKAIFVLMALGTLMPAVSFLRSRGLSAERSRKLVHVIMGLICASFPFIFTTDEPVWALAALAIFSMAVIRSQSKLKSSLGSALHHVDRTSYGELLFPLSIAFTWTYSKHQWEIYTPSIMVLAFADAAAALVGQRFGKRTFHSSDGLKSLEGCSTFFMVAFLILLLPSWLLCNFDFSKTVMVALSISFLVMLFEASSWRGFDNLFIPVAVCFFLFRYPQLSFPDLSERLIIAILFCIIVYVAKNKSTLDGSALLGAVLFVYGLYFLGEDIRFLLGPFIVFFSYTRLSPPTEENLQHQHDIHAVLCTCIPSLLWVIFHSPSQHSLWLSHACFTGQLACMSVARLAFDFPTTNWAKLCLQSTIIPWLLMTLPFLASGYWSSQDLAIALILLPMVLIVTMAFWKLQPSIRDCPSNTPRWIRQCLIASCCSIVPLVML